MNAGRTVPMASVDIAARLAERNKAMTAASEKVAKSHEFYNGVQLRKK